MRHEQNEDENGEDEKKEEVKEDQNKDENGEDKKKEEEETSYDGLISLVITWLIFIIGLISCIIVAVYIVTKDLPYVDLVHFQKDESKWNKTKENIATEPPTFCSVTPEYAPSMKTDNVAMLTTLPRLYGVHDGKCFIKPKLRGVFNSTMKYIFGEDFESQGIKIMCYTKTNDPYLIISSTEFDKYVIDKYDPKDIKENNPEQFDVRSEEYFDQSNLCKDGKAASLCRKYQECIKKNSDDTTKCKDEWEAYTNEYWKTFDLEYEELKGFEQYQLTVEDDTIIQPRIVTNNDEKVSGTHFIVGGGFENGFGYGMLIEVNIRRWMPVVLGNLIPLYSAVTNLFHEAFDMVTKFANKLIYVESVSYREIRLLSQLLTKFNMSRSSIYMVGHSISGSTIKELSFITDIRGMAFEASIARDVASSCVDEDFEQLDDGTLKLSNIYSDGMYLSGNDEEFQLNGRLPNKFYNPNVYDTACQVAVSCSTTRKFVPFCEQVLNQGGDDPKAMFQEILDAYYKDQNIK